MNSFKSCFFLAILFFFVFLIACTTMSYAAFVTVGQNASKASTTYFCYNPGSENSHEVINNAINEAAQQATVDNPGVVFIENAFSPYELNSHIICMSNVNIKGESRAGVTLKIAKGITPVPYKPDSTGWGGKGTSDSEKGAIINIWSNISNVNISNITFDGSSDDYYPERGRGHGEFILINIEGASNINIKNCKFIRGADDGILSNHGSNNIEVSSCVFNVIGHDCFQVWNSSDIKFHHNICAMRTNSGARFSGSGSNCQIYDNEFYTGSEGGAAVELQTKASNVKIFNNYFHDISGVEGKYGAIGYVGQNPVGNGHEYYNNLFVNCPYAIAYVPSSSVSQNNIMINTPVTVAQGIDTNNIKTDTGYVFKKHGTDGQGDTFWTVTSGPLASVFAGIKVGIDPITSE